LSGGRRKDGIGAEPDVAEQAQIWHEALKTCGPAGRREFAVWLRQSPMHVKFFLQMTLTSSFLERVWASGLIDAHVMLHASRSEVIPIRDK
jgi:hypothetical protein